MTAAATPYLPNKKQQDAIVMYVINCVETLAETWNLRQQFLLKDQIYYREVDRSVEQSRATIANRNGDPFKFQNTVIPVAMPQVESALAYHSGVFFTGYPIFGVAADPKNADAALQMESVIADNSIKYRWLRELILFLRDGLKYNFGALEVSWKKKNIYNLINDPANLQQAGKKTEQVYAGNHLRRLDPYNTIWDKRVLNPVEVPEKGEFIGYTELMGRVQLKQLLLDLDSQFTTNAKQAFESGVPAFTLNGSDSWYFIPQVNPLAWYGASVLPTTNWLAWAMLDGQQKQGIEYNNMYEVTTLYGRIIPMDFMMSVPQRNQPQIWKFIVVNRRVVIYVERQTNAHNLLPVLICQPTEDGLGYQSKSILDNAAPYQALSTSLWNSVIESKRRLVYDRIFYDPSRVRKEDIDKADSVARIPVKQSAYGKPVGEAVYAFPYRDEQTAGAVQLAQMVGEMADIANGQNRVQRGQFQRGNKTRTEFTETMGAANSRQQLQAMMIEHQTFVPLKEMLKINILQYQGTVTYYNPAEKQAVTVDPKTIREADLAFKISDGLLPTDKLLSTDLLQVFMQTLQTSPLMQAEFDIVGAFAYWCKTQGAQWFEDFRRNPQDRAQVLAQLSQMENAGKSAAARPQNQQGT